MTKVADYVYPILGDKPNPNLEFFGVIKVADS